MNRHCLVMMGIWVLLLVNVDGLVMMEFHTVQVDIDGLVMRGAVLVDKDDLVMMFFLLAD